MHFEYDRCPMKKKVFIFTLVLSLTSCGSMKLATQSGFTFTPKIKTEKELKNSANNRIALGIFILLFIFIGDRIKVI